LAIIERNASAQAKLIEDILNVSQIIAGKVVLDLRRVQLSNVVQNAVDSIRRGTRVLVVDDEDDARDLVATVLREAGATVVEVSSLGAATTVLAACASDVVVSDIGMPAEDGYSLIQRLRSEGPPGTRHIPALALTAYARPEARRRAFAAGFQEHAAKPVDPYVLVTLVASLARRQRG